MVATKSPHRFHRHGCVIVYNREIIVEACNHQALHAETAALKRLTSMLDPSALQSKNRRRHLRLYVVRIGTDNMGNPLKYSKPCLSCQNAIVKTGIIDRVFYSSFGWENFDEI